MKKIILLSILFLSACASDAFISTHGNMPPKAKIELVEVGDSKQEVVDLLGFPSNVSVLDVNTWIYMSSVSKKIAFLEPKIISRDILVIKFNNELVSEIKTEDLSSGKNIAIATEETPSLGSEPGFFEKAFGTLSPSLGQ